MQAQQQRNAKDNRKYKHSKWNSKDSLRKLSCGYGHEITRAEKVRNGAVVMVAEQKQSSGGIEQTAVDMDGSARLKK